MAWRTRRTNALSTLGFGMNTFGDTVPTTFARRVVRDLHRHRTVRVVTDAGREPLADLALHHHEEALDHRRGLERADHDGRRDVVRKVRDHHPGVSRVEARVPVDAQRVVVHDLDIASLDDFFEDRHEMTIELDRAHVRARVGQRDRERTDAGTDLDDPIARLQLREPHDAARGVRVGEEVLTERLRRPHAVAGQELGDLARGHRSTPNARAAFARVISAMSSGSTPRARASAAPTATTSAGSFGLPRNGSGVRNGESVSTRMRSAGVIRAASRQVVGVLERDDAAERQVAAALQRQTLLRSGRR